MAAGGWIKLHRQLQDHELWTDERFSRGQAWIDLLMLANFEPNTIRIRGIAIPLERGQLAWSKDRLAERWGWHPRTVSKFLEWLEHQNMIEIRSSKLTTIITIRQYKRYQESADQNADQNMPKSAEQNNGINKGRNAENSTMSAEQSADQNMPKSAYREEVKEVKEKSKSKEETPPGKPAASMTPKKKNSEEDYVFPGIPDWIEPQPWNEFLVMRKRIFRAPLTDWGKHLTVLKLEKLRSKGQDPNAVLNQSTQNGWKGLWAVKEEDGGGRSGGGQYKTATEKRAELQREKYGSALDGLRGRSPDPDRADALEGECSEVPEAFT